MTTPQTAASYRYDGEHGLFSVLRGLVPNRPLRYREAERLAELQANRLRELLGIDGPRLPDEAITELPRILVAAEHDLPVSGSAHWSNGRWIIVLNALDHPLRQRFSLCHELKHVLDHTTKASLYPEEAGLPASVKAERIADLFAAMLLMPKRHVKRLYGEGVQQPTELAEHFEVSVQAMNYRLQQLGLTEPKGRCLPYRRGLVRSQSDTSYSRPLATMG
ncbi:MAG: hypothetical protein QOG53_1389 [Frankiales bacterium]|jgi:Zn-dependent peptidase ImmA (M78 family)|nr:hypothetical protein [Frankiales bacterium]